MPILELTFYTAVLTVFITLWLVPLGVLLAKKFFPGLSRNLSFFVSFGISAAVYAGVTAALSLAGVPNSIIRILLLSIYVVSLILWIGNGLWRELKRRSVVSYSVIHFTLLVLCLLTNAFPEGDLRDVMNDTGMYLTGLPVDLLIPYNVSRYVTEKISANAYDVVPGWKATDRGPLAGLLNSALFIMLGLEEKEYWLVTTPSLFYVYTALLIYLNLLSLFAVQSTAKEFFGEKVALYAMLVLVGSYFYFTNILFVWPKFFMCYYYLAAVTVWRRNGSGVLVGSFFALAELAHNGASLVLVPFLAIVFVNAVVRHFSAVACYKSSIVSHRGKPSKWAIFDNHRREFVMVGALLAVKLPWVAFRIFGSPPSPRLFYMNLLCQHGEDAVKLGAMDAIRQYLSGRTIGEMFVTRINNIVYPFSLKFMREAWQSFSANEYLFLNQLSTGSFCQFHLGLGLISFLFMLYGLVIFVLRYRNTEFSLFILTAFGALFVFGLATGCDDYTLNHHWAYPAFTVGAIIAGLGLAHAPSALLILFGLGLGLNLVITLLAYHYQTILSPLLHSSAELVWTQALLIVFVFGFLLWNLTSVSSSKENQLRGSLT